MVADANLNSAFDFQAHVRTLWSSRDRVTRMEARILTNQHGCFLKLTDKASNKRSISISILEGLRAEGWRLFQHHLYQLYGHLQPTTTVARRNDITLAHSHQQHHSLPKPGSLQAISNPPWKDPHKSVSLFDKFQATAQSNPIPHSRWNNAVICDWVNPQKDIHSMAPRIARKLNLSPTPSFLSFGVAREQAPLSNRQKSNLRVVDRYSVYVEGEIVW